MKGRSTDKFMRVPTVGMAGFRYLKSPGSKGGNTTKSSACLIVDVGYSFMHAVPVVLTDSNQPRIIPSAVRRINLGTKVLLGLLKEELGYRQLCNVQDDEVSMEECLEKLGYVVSEEDGGIDGEIDRGRNSVVGGMRKSARYV